MATITTIAAVLSLTYGTASIDLDIKTQADSEAFTAGSATIDYGNHVTAKQATETFTAGSAYVQGARYVVAKQATETFTDGSAVIDHEDQPNSRFLAAAAKTGHKPVWLMELTHNGTTYYYSDRSVSDGTNTYEARITEWGDISYINDRLSGGGIVNNVSITMSEIGASGWSPVSPKIELGNKVNIYCWFENEGLTVSDRLLVFSGRIIDPIEMNEAQISFTLDSHERYHNAQIGNLVHVDEFPGADPDDIGEMKPIIYGQVYGHRCLAVDAGSIDNLAKAINSTATSIELTDASAFPSSGTIQVDLEQIAYTEKSGNLLGGITRGYNASTAVSHDAGAKVAEVQTEYKYLIADHNIDTSSVTVYVDDVRQTGNDFTVYNENNQSFVKFTTRPYLKKSVDIEVETTDDIGVESTLIVKDSSQTTTTTEGTITFSQTSTTQPKTIFVSTDEYSDYGWDAIGIDFPDPVGMIIDWRSVLNFSFYKTLIGADSLGRPVNSTIRIRFNGDLIYEESINNGVTVNKKSSSFTDDKNSATLFIEIIGMGSMRFTFNSATRTGTSRVSSTSVTTTNVDVIGEVKKTTGARVDNTKFETKLTGNDVAETVIGRRVLVDCIGYNYHKPNDVINHLLLNYGTNITTEQISTSISTDTLYKTAVNKVGFAITEQSDLMTLCRKIAWQAQARFFWERGKARMALIKDSSYTPVRNITQPMTILGSISMKRTEYKNLVNKINARYMPTWLKAPNNKWHYKKSYKTSNTDSITANGERKQDQWFDFDLITDETTAQALSEFYLKYFGEINKIIRFSVPLGKGIDINRGDIVALTYSLDGGCIMRKCEVLEKHITLGSGRDNIPDKIELVCYNTDNGTRVECENNRIVYSSATTLSADPDNQKDYVFTGGSLSVSGTVTVPSCTKITVIST